MNPFASLAARRIGHGLVMYLLMCLAYSIVFNGVADNALRARIEEEVVLSLRAAGNLAPADYDALRSQLRASKIRQYRLDEPLVSRVLWRALDVATFRFGRSQTVTSSAGDRDVLTIVLQALL